MTIYSAFGQLAGGWPSAAPGSLYDLSLIIHNTSRDGHPFFDSTRTIYYTFVDSVDQLR